MNTSGMVKKLQKQAHAAELKAIAARHKLAVMQVKRDLADGLRVLKAEMAQEVKTVADAIPRRASGRVAKKGLLARAPKKPVDVAALLASAKRK